MHSGGSRRAACSPISGRRSLGTDGLVSFRSQSLFYGKRHKRFLTPYYIPCAAKSKEGFCIKFSAPARGVLPRHLSSLSGGEFAETASKRMLSPRRCKVYRKKERLFLAPPFGRGGTPGATAVPTLSHSARGTQLMAVWPLHPHSSCNCTGSVRQIEETNAARLWYEILPYAGGGTEGQLRPQPLCAGPLGHSICCS